MSEKTQKTAKTRRETAVQGTNDSSILSKCSVAALGYIDDPFIQYFASKNVRRSPIINRGYYIRAKCMDIVVKEFLLENAGHKKQIISFGSGYDTLYFRLKREKLLKDTMIVETDFPEVMKKKLQIIRYHPELYGLLDAESEQEPVSPHLVLNCKNYKMVGLDICKVDMMDSVLKSSGVNFDLPTLFISEVVLTYINKTSTEHILQWAATSFPSGIFCLYEQLNPQDAFGQTMLSHFRQIGSPLKCIEHYPDQESQQARFLSLGWKQCESYDLNSLYWHALSSEERERIEQIEPFDEHEEWHMKCAHYMLLLAYSKEQPSLLRVCLEIGSKRLSGTHVAMVTGFSLHDLAVSEPVPVIQTHPNMMKLLPYRVEPPSALALFQRFGHSSSLVGNRLLIVTGGFGIQNKHHRRMSSIGILDTLTGQAFASEVQKELQQEVARMHHSSFTSPDGRVLIFGGRASPMRASKTMLALTLEPAEEAAKDAASPEDDQDESTDAQGELNSVCDAEVDVPRATVEVDGSGSNSSDEIEAVGIAESENTADSLSEPKEIQTDEAPLEEKAATKTGQVQDVAAASIQNTEASGKEKTDVSQVRAKAGLNVYAKEWCSVKTHAPAVSAKKDECLVKDGNGAEEKKCNSQDKGADQETFEKEEEGACAPDFNASPDDLLRLSKQWPIQPDVLKEFFVDLYKFTGTLEDFQLKLANFVNQHPPWDPVMMENMITVPFSGDVGSFMKTVTTWKHIPRAIRGGTGCHVDQTQVEYVSGNVPSERWRQAAVNFFWEGNARTFLYGGTNWKNIVLDDCYLLDLSKRKWRKLRCGGALPGPRHSQTVNFWQENYVVMAGGLNKFGEAERRVHLLHLSSLTWESLAIIGPLHARFGHVSHIRENLLFLLGGVQEQDVLPSVGVVNLDTGEAKEFYMPDILGHKDGQSHPTLPVLSPGPSHWKMTSQPRRSERGVRLRQR